MTKPRKPKELRVSIAPSGQELCVHIPLRLTYHLLRRVPKQPDGLALEILSPRERQVFTLMREGLSAKEISSRMDICTRTVKFHLSSIYKLLNMSRQDILVHYGKIG